MTDTPKPKLTPKQNVLATFAAIRKLLGDEEVPPAIRLVQCEALAVYGAVELEKVEELRRARRERRSA